jgi:osmoprotectant transport system ATP-binding protein
VIQLQDVSKSFDGGSTFAVRNLSLSVATGETLVLVGSSGCGKTTTLKMINRLVAPTSGTVEVDGMDVLQQDPVQLRRAMGYVFQGIGLFPHMTILENVEIGLKLNGWRGAKVPRRAAETLDLVGLPPEQFAYRLPEELSGGQQQRVGVARALAHDPEYLLMDEPFGALDALTRRTLQQELAALNQRVRKTIVFVTHDILEALLLGDRLAVMHEGRLEQLAPKEEVLARPASCFVRDLFAEPIKQLDLLREVT